MHNANKVALLTLSIIVLVSVPSTILRADQDIAGNLLREAEQEADEIGNEYLRVSTLRDIAVAEAKTNNPKNALDIVLAIKKKRDDRNLILVEIAEVQAKSHHIKAAFQTVDKIDDGTDRAAAMVSIALAQLAAGDRQGALNTAHLIPAEVNRSRILMRIALTEAESGNITHAIEMAQHIQAPFLKDIALQGIALVQMKQRDDSGSVATAHLISRELSRAKAYRAIAAQQAYDGKEDASRLWISRLRSPLERASALLGLANGISDAKMSRSKAPSEQ